MNNNQHECDRDPDHYHHTIRPTSSSLIRAPSWSLGFGADIRETEDLDHDGDCCHISGSSREHNTLSSSLPNSSSSDMNRVRSSSSVEVQQNNCPRISIEIPTVYLTRNHSSSSSTATTSSFHVYQLNIKTSADVEWSVYRRYSQFLALHQRLKTKEPAIGKFTFPSKRRLNSKASTIVQDRRRKLEEYMRLLCNYIAQLAPNSTESGSYQLLHHLATNGPQRVSSRVGSVNEEVSSLSDSARSEHQLDLNEMINDDQQLQQQQQQRDETQSLGGGGDSLSNHTFRSRFTLNGRKSANIPSVRYLFYEFISPEGNRDDEFELAHLGV